MKTLAAVLLFVTTTLLPVRCGFAQTPMAPCSPMTPAELRDWSKAQDERQEELIAIENSGIKYSSFVATDIKVRTFQDIAVVTCLWSSRGTLGEKAFSRQWRVTHVFVYGQQGWKTVASQETLLPG